MLKRVIKISTEQEKVLSPDVRKTKQEVKDAFELVLKRHGGAFKLLADCDAGKIPPPDVDEAHSLL